MTDQQLPILSDLSRCLAAKKETYGTFQKLSEAIEESYGHKVDRRKLARLAKRGEHEDKLMEIPLTLHELAALDTFLKLDGGLATIFELKNVLRSLVEKRRITFLLGARSVTDTDHISRWDVRAMNEIQRGIYQQSRDVHMEIADIYLREDPAKPLNPKNYKKEFERERWYQLLEDPSGPSCVCIGSPRSCNAAELMLAKMFNVDPFDPGNAANKESLPFMFVWSNEEYDNIQSTFALNETDVPELPELKKNYADPNTRHKVRSLRVKHKLLNVNPGKKPWSTYGIIAISQRNHGQLWVVCAGLSGTATFSASRLLRTISCELTQATSQDPPPVIWATLEARVELLDNKRGDTRSVINENLLDVPEKYIPT